MSDRKKIEDMTPAEYQAARDACRIAERVCGARPATCTGWKAKIYNAAYNAAYSALTEPAPAAHPASMTQREKWTARAPVKPGVGLMRGGVLIDPSGDEVAKFPGPNGLSLSYQVAAAMNLTTAKDRHTYCGEAAGYTSKRLAQFAPDVADKPSFAGSALSRRAVVEIAEGLTSRQLDALKAARDEGGAVRLGGGIRSRVGGARRRMCERMGERGLVGKWPPFPITRLGLRVLAIAERGRA